MSAVPHRCEGKQGNHRRMLSPHKNSHATGQTTDVADQQHRGVQGA